MHFLTSFFVPLALAVSTVVADLIPFDSWEHGRVALQDVSIHFRYAGSGPPVLLVHGNPQHSLTWQHIGPILAQNYTVIAPDNRGAGDSSVPINNDYSAETNAADLKAVLDFLNITSAYVISHDKGVGFAMALAALHPDMVQMLSVIEYVVPGFGYEMSATPAPYWDLYANWQLAFFQVTDLAEFLMRGKEREFLLWYFYHSSYSGPEAFTQETVDRYASTIQKPGFLRSMLGPFSAQAVGADSAFFNRTLGSSPLEMPMLVMGGEACMGFEAGLSTFDPLGTNIERAIVPKAGHWIADENPVWVANRLLRFLGSDSSPLPSVDLSSFSDRATLTVGYFGTLGNAALGGLQ